MATPNIRRKVNIIGHQNPDTDSICSALAYAWFKNRDTSVVYEARRAGKVSLETQFVLDYFGVEAPRLCTDVSPQIKDIDIREQPGIDGEMSLRDAWIRMRDTECDTLCVIDESRALQGLITVKDIANANLDLLDVGVLAEAHTSCHNVLTTLNGTLITGDELSTFTRGKIRIGTTPQAMEAQLEAGDIVLADRCETQTCALECGAGCLIVCNGADVPRTVLARAQENGCTVIATGYDTYATARLINMAAPVRHFMVRENLLLFNVNTSIEDAGKVMARVRHRYFPVLDEQGKYTGMVSRRNLLNLHRKQVILVDHNERSQAVEGLEQAEILEIIDHHRIGDLQTSGPVYFRNVPVGCTATILYRMFCEANVTPPKQIAGLLVSAILSDTLLFRSPTSTPLDEDAARALARIAQVDIPVFAQRMFEAGGDLTGRSAEDVFFSDFKVFSRGDIKFGVGQSSYMTRKNRTAAETLIRPFLPKALSEAGLPMIFYMFTDVQSQSTDLMCIGAGAQDIVRDAFGVEFHDGKAKLENIVSRKKQLIPALMTAMQVKQ